MSHQQCFAFVAEEKASMNVGKRPTEKEINEKAPVHAVAPRQRPEQRRACKRNPAMDSYSLTPAWKSRDRQDR